MHPIGVFICKWVSTYAVVLPGITGGGRRSSQDIHTLGYKFQMKRIDTATITTQMIYLEALWEWAV